MIIETRVERGRVHQKLTRKLLLLPAAKLDSREKPLPFRPQKLQILVGLLALNLKLKKR